jgi:hypothetical protein
VPSGSLQLFGNSEAEHELDQNSFGGRLSGAEVGILDAPWRPASAQAILGADMVSFMIPSRGMVMLKLFRPHPRFKPAVPFARSRDPVHSSVQGSKVSTGPNFHSQI